MSTKVTEIAQRLKALREICDYSEEDMAKKLSVSADTYKVYESGEQDFSVTVLQKCADIFNVDIIELMTGENPHLSLFTVTREGNGVSMQRRAGFTYQHMAYNLRGKLAEPFVVTAPYIQEQQDAEIALSTHEGQEFDYILSGSLKVRIEDKFVILNEGDAIMYDSSHGHGMIAVGGKDCRFMAVVLKGRSEKNK